ncbi:hypothetical protein C1H76_0834 [Elsinoe australis]|uniref:Uncharacterized protein n=1 Tax=Elsinoe australis TaxID=40998 RepID=A0A4U7BFJ8_9PEZI|nr:hypothetical protein C1H76_0834 [Elsinoe australis]
MTGDICSAAEAFATRYVSLWSSQDSSSLTKIAGVAQQVASRYRPGFTFFTNGQVARFESQAGASALIEKELRAAIEAGLGAHMTLKALRSQQISDTSALCWITFEFHPAESSGRQNWTFTNLYGYRAETQGASAGFEFVVRDQEANEMKNSAGNVFDT